MMLPLLSNGISEAGQVWAASIRKSILLTNVAIVVRSSLLHARDPFDEC
jgi:hypothetical protein